jgi:signal transduction histidine kinase
MVDSVVVASQWRWTWMDLLWLVFLGGLAALPPVREIHKQLILVGFGVWQLSEGRVLSRSPRHGRVLAMVVKIGLATLLIAHTGEVAINSSYFPIFYVPVVTAAMLFGPRGTLGWTAVASGAYCAYLLPALRHYSLDAYGRDQLALRVFFFFLLALIINRFVMESREAAAGLLVEQERTRRAERLAALGQLSAGLAHEIRNPLAVIKGSAEMLSKESAGAGALPMELAGYISSEVDRVNVLVSRFLDFARPLRLDRQPIDIPALLDRALADAEHRWPQAQIEVTRAFPTGLPRVAVDRTLMERVFANLINNAFEAMAPAGGGRLTMGASGETAGIRVWIQDSGPGVPSELREQIFNPFFTTKPAGTGLGLAIVSKIMDQHGGELTLVEGASPASPGARFEVFLPYGEHSDRG